MIFRKTLKYYAKDLFVSGGYWHIKRLAKGHTFTAKTIKNKNGFVKNYIIPIFGNNYPQQLTVQKIDNALINLRVAPATKNKILVCLSEIYKPLNRSFNPRTCARCDSCAKWRTSIIRSFNPRICVRCDTRRSRPAPRLSVSIHASV